MDKLICKAQKDGKHGKFKRSRRKHGQPGRFFVICGFCGAELQATKNGIFDNNSAKNRPAESQRATHYVPSRLTDDYYNRIPAGITGRMLIEAALDYYAAGVIQLPYKQ